METRKDNPKFTYQVYAAIYFGHRNAAAIMRFLHAETEYQQICYSLARLQQEGVVICDDDGYMPVFMPTK